MGGERGRGRERQTDRNRETDRQTDRQTDRERQRETETDTYTHKYRDFKHIPVQTFKNTIALTHTQIQPCIKKNKLQGTSFQTFAVSALLTGHFECGMARGTGRAWCGSVQLCILPQRTLHTHLGVGQIVALRAAHCINKEQRV